MPPISEELTIIQGYDFILAVTRQEQMFHSEFICVEMGILYLRLADGTCAFALSSKLELKLQPKPIKFWNDI